MLSAPCWTHSSDTEAIPTRSWLHAFVLFVFFLYGFFVSLILWVFPSSDFAGCLPRCSTKHLCYQKFVVFMTQLLNRMLNGLRTFPLKLRSQQMYNLPPNGFFTGPVLILSNSKGAALCGNRSLANLFASQHSRSVLRA